MITEKTSVKTEKKAVKSSKKKSKFAKAWEDSNVKPLIGINDMRAVLK